VVKVAKVDFDADNSGDYAMAKLLAVKEKAYTLYK
jgi:hypothetical protein